MRFLTVDKTRNNNNNFNSKTSAVQSEGMGKSSTAEDFTIVVNYL